MDMQNFFQFEGNLTRDPEQRHGMTCYTLARRRTYLHNGERKETTDYLPVQTFGRQAENDLRYLRRGDCVTVHGHIESWSQPQERKSGFNFVAERVTYRAKASGRADAGEKAEALPSGDVEDEWLREYQEAEAAVRVRH